MPGGLSMGWAINSTKKVGIIVVIFQGTRFVSLALFFTLIFALILLTPGCGSSGNQASLEEIEAVKEQRKKKEEEERAAHIKMVVAKKTEKEQKRREIEKRRTEAEAARLRLRNQSRKSEHPSLIGDWTDKDFYIAKVEQDRRLYESIEYLANYNKDPQRAVRLLGELITPGTPLTKKELDEIGVRLTYKYDKQVKLLAEALVACDTDQSVELVEKIISGKVPTDASGVAIPTLLQTIAERPTERNEPVFLNALREQREGTDKLLATIINRGASGAFRFTLAEYSMASSCPESKRQMIWDMLCKDDPRNLPAALLLYRDDRLPGAYRTILERQFAGLAQSAVCRVCGFPSEGDGNEPKKQKNKISRDSDDRDQLVTHLANGIGEEELITQVQNNLWNDQFSSLLAKRLYQVDSLEEDSQLILLAMNTPREEPRKMLGDLLLRNWQETPTKLGSIGFPEKVIAEPGFWLVAKHVLNKSGVSEEGTVKKGSRSRGRIGRQEENVDPVKMAWKQAFGKMLVAMCGRLEAAGRPVYSQEEITGASTSVASEPSSLSDTFSIASLLHAKARPVTKCKLQMPNDSLSLHYVRCEELARPEVILKHYRGKLDGASELAGPTLCWLGALMEEESGDAATEGDAKRFHSIDVLLKIEQNEAGAINPTGKLEISVEILLISSK